MFDRYSGGSGKIGEWLEGVWEIVGVNVEWTVVEWTLTERTFVERTMFKVKGAVCLSWGVCGSLV